MKNYLCFGIATKLIIKNKLEFQEEPLDETLSDLKFKLDLELYDIKYLKNSIVLEIKKDIFEKYAIDFIKEQWLNIDYKERFYIIQNFDTLKNLKYEKIMSEVKYGFVRSCHFLSSDKIFNDISYVDILGKSNISCDLFSYLIDGPLLLKNEECTLNYLRNSIIESSENPIRKGAFISISCELF